jgi:hypothetical protein
MVDETRCRQRIFKDWRAYQCTRKVWKDGYCKQHPPDTVKKRREESQRKYDESRKQSCWYRLEQASLRIKELEVQNEVFRGALSRIANHEYEHAGEQCAAHYAAKLAVQALQWRG